MGSGQTNRLKKQPVDNGTETAKSRGTNTEDSGSEANLSQVRDILFGSQMRDYDQRLARVEDRLMTEIGLLREDIKKRTDALELYAKNEFESVVGRLHAEQSERNSSLQNVSKEINEISATLEKKIAQLDEQLTKSERSLRQHTLDQTNGLRDDVQEKHGQLNAALQRELGQLRETKTDRAALGDLLREMALRLNDGLRPPEGDQTANAK